MYCDILLKNGKIIDGRGNPWYKGDIAIKDGRIKQIGHLPQCSTREEIDLQGQYVSPGFIDSHTHSDLVFFIDSRAQSKVRQGVTTEVTGNCGMSIAPYISKAKESPLKIMNDFKPSWETIKEYLEALAKQPKTVNIAPLIGHGALRAAFVGMEDRPATESEMMKMRHALKKGLEKGAIGLSFGLYFVPGSYATKDELIELAKIVAEYQSVLAAHTRDEGDRTVGLVSSVKEFIEIARQSGASIQISHIKAVGPGTWGLSEVVLDLIKEARREGIDVTCDQYPFVATGGSVEVDVLPTSYKSGKTREEIIQELKNPKLREEIREQVAIRIKKKGGASTLTIVDYPVNCEFEGRTLQEISAQLGKSPADTAIEMLIASSALPEGKSKISWICHSLNQNDVDTFMEYPGTMISSDGSSLSLEGILSEGF